MAGFSIKLFICVSIITQYYGIITAQSRGAHLRKEVMPMWKRIILYIFCLIVLFLLFMAVPIKAN